MPKAKRTTRSCDCAKKVNKKLAEKNAELVREMMINMDAGRMYLSNPVIALRKKDTKKRGAVPTLFAMYCPFCGRKYPSK